MCERPLVHEKCDKRKEDGTFQLHFVCFKARMDRKTEKRRERKRNADGSGSKLLFPPHSVCIVPITAVWNVRPSMEAFPAVQSLAFPSCFGNHAWFVRYAGGM